MNTTVYPAILLSLTLGLAYGTETWPEARGPNGNFHLASDHEYSTEWSVILDQGILWRTALPETGHSGIAVAHGRLFLTCFAPLSAKDNGPKGTWAANGVGLCYSAETGDLLWTVDLPGRRPNQVNGTFTDSTTPTPVTDGVHVWFVNAGGSIVCCNMEGSIQWQREFEVRTKHSAKQFQPFLADRKLHYVMMRDSGDPQRRPQTAKDYDKNSKQGWPWMFVRSFDARTGDASTVVDGGVSVHSKGARGSLRGKQVLLHSRGGGHFPPETPFGLTLTRLGDATERVWQRDDLYFEGTHFIDQSNAYCFDGNDFVILDLETGQTRKRISMRGSSTVMDFDVQAGTYRAAQTVNHWPGKRLNTHRSNIGVGNYHFFMAGREGYLGRINLTTGDVSYLQVPIQVLSDEGKLTYSWDKFQGGDQTGSGFQVQGDARRLLSGFGHVSAATPIVINSRIYFTTMLGTVYVVDGSSERFDEKALIEVNDLGSAGKTWTLSSFSAANGKLFQRTARELICIQK